MNYIEQGIKVGDKVWTIQEGETRVTRIVCDTPYPITTSKGNSYTAEGKLYSDDKHPSLFWSNPHIQAPEKPKPFRYQFLWRSRESTHWNLLGGRYVSEEEARIQNDFNIKISSVELRRIDP